MWKSSWARNAKRPSRRPRGNPTFYRIVFAGTAEFAVPCLRAIHSAGHEIALVVMQPDRPAGRGMRMTLPSVKVAAQQLGLHVYQPEKVRDPEAVERLKALAPDFLVVVAYGQIIPRVVLDIPRLGALNVHASLLPRWRGAAPVARAILAGDHETGVSIMKMDEQLDHGPVLAAHATLIEEGEDAAQLGRRLAGIGAQLLVETLEHFDEVRVVGQDHSQATLAPKLTKEEGELEWSMGAGEIDRRVRALQPWPGATLPTSRGRVKVLRGHVEGDRYVPDLVQLPGKKPAPARQVLPDA
ncbi:MAG TPA: methionyl-tRNA formyltransferase [Candidatus Dormibacteraeota bacterium]|nr:methionyl-tRNA formyltransferase [Candidatus Dormibacteraeota bacterium]